MFFSSLSHEMRTPLFSVLSCVDLVLQMELGTDGARDILLSAQASGQGLSGKVDYVLSLAKASAAAASIELAPTQSSSLTEPLLAEAPTTPAPHPRVMQGGVGRVTIR